MTLEEAIKHCEEKEREQALNGCFACAEEHRQLAKWLKDYKRLLEEKPQAENALLKDIAHSLAIIADNSTKEGNTQESGNEMLHWVHSEAHKVMCPKCGCRVSINAAYEMNYCFKCGAKLGGIKNDNS